MTVEKRDAFKFGYLFDGDDLPYVYPNIWAREQTKGPDRLVLAPEATYVDLILALTNVLPEPFAILYVLVMPRSDEEPGRYQSPLLERAEMKEFLEEFRSLFEQDGRHHVWVTSLRQNFTPNATLVYDQHNVVYAYGPLEDFQAILLERGMKQVDAVRFPAPHTHHYNASLDREVERLLTYWEWHKTPLQPGDEW